MEPNEIIVLGAIRRGAKKFGKIRSKTNIDPASPDNASGICICWNIVSGTSTYHTIALNIIMSIMPKNIIMIR